MEIWHVLGDEAYLACLLHEQSVKGSANDRYLYLDSDVQIYTGTRICMPCRRTMSCISMMI